MYLVLRKRRIWFCGSRINPARVSTVWFDERNFHFRLNLSCSSSYIYTVNVFIGLRILYALSRSVLFLLSLMSSIECIAIAVLCVNDYKQRKRTDCISSSLSLSLPCVCVCNVDKEKFTNKMCAFRKTLLFALFFFLYEFYNKFFLIGYISRFHYFL